VIADSVAQDLHDFMLERLKPYCRDKLFEADEIDAIVSLNPTRFDQVLPRLKALQAFRALPQAEALAAANKRIRNILKQAGDTTATTVDPALLREPAEQQLSQEVEALRAQVQPLFSAGNYAAALKALASLRPSGRRVFRQGDGDGRGRGAATQPACTADEAEQPVPGCGGYFETAGSAGIVRLRYCRRDLTLVTSYI